MRRMVVFLCLISCSCAGLFFVRCTSADDIADRARQLHFSSIVLDTHADTPQRLLTGTFDLGKRDAEGHVDIPRMREGGLNAQFFSIFITGRTLGPPAIQQALDQIDLVRQNLQHHSKDLTLATTAEEIRRAHAQGKIAILMGMEGGHMVGNDIHMVRNYAQLGVRYMTLAHFYNDEWADSSTDKPAHNGLTDFGKQVVREMNRQGMMVDISHVSDKTFYDAIEASSKPVIASHSSCRALTNMPRNMTDEMLRALAKNGGVVGINFYPGFISQRSAAASKKKIAAQASAQPAQNAKALDEFAAKEHFTEVTA